MLRQVELSVGRPPDPTWKRPPGRPRAKWTDQLRHDKNNAPMRLCGGKLLVAVTRERRYGPNRLRVNDDDSSFTCNVIIDVQKTRKPFAVGLLPEPRWVSLSPLQVHLGNIYNSSPLNASGISGSSTEEKS